MMDKWVTNLNKKRGYSNEFVIIYAQDDQGNFVLRESPAMTALEQALTAVGKLQAFEDYCSYEEYLRSQLRKRLIEIDKDDSFDDDFDEPSEHKRDYAKYMVEREVLQTLFNHRASLMASATC